jgi:hypothetical protein
MAKRIRTTGSDRLNKPLKSAPLSQTHPHLASEWRHTGPDNPDNITAGSGKVANWKHERCGRRLKNIPVARRTRAFDEGCESEGCKYCSGSYLRVRRMPEPLSDELIAQCVDEPGLTLARYLFDNSKEIRLWCCRFGHLFRTRVTARVGKPNQKQLPQGCPCKRCYKGQRVNLEETTYSELFKRTRRNEGYDPKSLPADFRVFWGCFENKKHQSFLSYLELLEKGCLVCHRESNKSFLSDEKYKHIACEFVEAVRFPGWRPENIRAGSAIVCTWKCTKFPEHIWRKSVCRRTRDGEGCPYCAGKRLAVSNSLASHPDITLEWDYDLNDTTPNTVRAGERKAKYWFRCTKNHSFQLTPWERTNRALGCKVCRVVPGNVAETHPWTVGQWHADPAKNPEHTPYNLTAGSRKIVWWQCPVAEDHAYQKSVYDRCVRGLGCPCCLNRQVSITNCLATCNPELAFYFDEEKNELSAYEVIASDGKPYWWLCECSASYQRSPYETARHGVGCNSCRSWMRKFRT